MKTLTIIVLLAALVFAAAPTQAQTVSVCQVWYSAQTVICHTYTLPTATPSPKPKRHKESSSVEEAYPPPGVVLSPMPTSTIFTGTKMPTATKRPTPTMAPTFTQSP